MSSRSAWQLIRMEFSDVSEFQRSRFYYISSYVIKMPDCFCAILIGLHSQHFMAFVYLLMKSFMLISIFTVFYARPIMTGAYFPLKLFFRVKMNIYCVSPLKFLLLKDVISSVIACVSWYGRASIFLPFVGFHY